MKRRSMAPATVRMGKCLAMYILVHGKPQGRMHVSACFCACFHFSGRGQGQHQTWYEQGSITVGRAQAAMAIDGGPARKRNSLKQAVPSWNALQPPGAHVMRARYQDGPLGCVEVSNRRYESLRCGDGVGMAPGWRWDCAGIAPVHRTAASGKPLLAVSTDSTSVCACPMCAVCHPSDAHSFCMWLAYRKLYVWWFAQQWARVGILAKGEACSTLHREVSPYIPR